MTWSNFKDNIVEAIPRLLELARNLTWNTISDNLEFILTEIKDSKEDNFRVRSAMLIQENNEKTPVSLSEILLKLQALYANLYDVNLHIYKAEKRRTIVEIAYYPKSSIASKEHRKLCVNEVPMLHCKVATPPWGLDRTKKFDINWQHKPKLSQCKGFWSFQMYCFQRWWNHKRRQFAGIK